MNSKAPLGGCAASIRKTASQLFRFVQRYLWSILSCLVASAGLTAVSIRAFLFGNGYYEYADQQWPPNASVYPGGYFSPSPVTSNGYFYPLQFSRDYITWPIGVLHSFNVSALTQEKVFYFYSFFFFGLLSYVLAALIVRYTLPLIGRSMPFWRQEAARLVIMLLPLTNLYFLYSNVDGGTFGMSVAALFLGISLVLIIAERDFLKVVTVAVALNSLGFLLEPELVPATLLCVAVALLVREIIGGASLGRIASRFAQLIIAFGGTALFFLYFFYPTIGGYGAVSIDYSVRTFNLGAIQGLTYNLTLLNVYRFSGYTWATLTFAPPAILSYQGPYQLIPGQEYPTTVLVMPGVISGFWMFSLLLPVTISLASLLVRKLRVFSLPLGSALLACVLATQWPSIAPVAETVSALAKVPLIGPAMGEALFFPDFFMLGESITTVVLLGVLIIWLMTSRPPSTLHVRRSVTLGSNTRMRVFTHARALVWAAGSRVDRSPATRGAAIALVVFLVVFPGWQAFSGSYLPSRSWPSIVSGNGVPNAAPFEPVQIPADVEQTYDYLYNQPGNFSIYWPTLGGNASNYEGGSFFFNVLDSPKPLASLPALPSLVASGDSGILVSYLQAENVGYLVLQNTSPSVLPEDYGLSEYPQLLGFFNNLSALSVILAFPNLTLYDVAGTWGETYRTSTLISPLDGSTPYAAAYFVGKGIGQTPAIVPSPDSAATLSVDNLSATEAILSPGFLENTTGAGTVGNQSLALPLATYSTVPQVPYTNFSARSASDSVNLIQSPGSLETISNWSLVNWGPSPVELNISGGVITWTALGSSVVTISAGSPLTQGPGGIEIQDPGSAACATSLNLSYRNSINFTGSLAGFLVSETTNSSTGYYPQQTSFAPSVSWRSASLEAPTLRWTQYFSTRFQVTLKSGSVQLSEVNYSWNLHTLTNFSWIVTQPGAESFEGWSLLNWSSTGPVQYTYSNSNLTLSTSGVATESLNFGPPLIDGPGGVTNPYAGSSGVVVRMSFAYRTSDMFQGYVAPNAFYQPSANPSAPAIALTGPTLAISSSWRSVAYSESLPVSTLNFTIRLSVVEFTGQVQLSSLSFSWAFLPADHASPFGVILPIANATKLSLPASTVESFGLLSGAVPAGAILVSTSGVMADFGWYEFRGSDIDLVHGDRLALLAVIRDSASLVDGGIVYTGYYSDDLVLTSGSQRFYPTETVDFNALFLYNGTGGFSIANEAVSYLTAYYLLFLIYLAAMYPVLVFLRRKKARRKEDSASELGLQATVSYKAGGTNSQGDSH